MCAHVNEKYGATQSVDEFFSYHFADVWKCSDAEVRMFPRVQTWILYFWVIPIQALERVHSFFESDLFVNLALVEGCKEALAALQPHFSLALVTSRQHAIQEVTEKWLEKNFPGVFDR